MGWGEGAFAHDDHAVAVHDRVEAVGDGDDTHDIQLRAQRDLGETT